MYHPVYITRSSKPSKRPSPPSLLQRSLYPPPHSGQATSYPHAQSSRWAPVYLSVRPSPSMGVLGRSFDPDSDVGAIDIKQSTHKSVKVFLKACAKEGLLKLKETKGDVVITGTSTSYFLACMCRMNTTPHNSRLSNSPIRDRVQTTQNRAGSRGEKRKGRRAREEGKRG